MHPGTSRNTHDLTHNYMQTGHCGI